ncbi:MAG: energy-coupling factor transporter transmembrane protein EcfT [Coriobacteriales bacterium]|jgi:energy-coupling factor transport system permease protein|nr:energy-coupling factor transporter transmembrane protein EcfT [Coriobacteriales bacterium]
MALVVPFGQYVPGNSIVHRLDARMKLLLVVAYVFALFMVDGWLGLLLCAAVFVGLYLLSGVPFKLAFRGLKPLIILLIFTFLANMLTFDASPLGESPPAEWTGPFALPESIALAGGFGIKPLGALRGLYFAFRIMLLVSLTSLLTYTTSVVSLSDGFVSILRPLARLKVPTEDIATMFSIALRFIPVTAEEAEKIMIAQSARGAVFNKGGLIKRTKAWLPVIIPLFVSLFRRADELACAMETRCYVGQGRTHLRVTEMAETDFVIGGIGALALILLGILL